MNELLFSLNVRHLLVHMVSTLLLAIALGSTAVHAHIGIAAEIEDLTARLEEDPDAPELYLLRGGAHRLNSHWPEALADFNKVLKLDPDNAFAELGLGKTWYDQGRYRKALKHLDRALALRPDEVRVLSARAKTLRRVGQPLAAAADYERAIAAFKDPATPLPEYYFEGARAYEAAGDGYTLAALHILDAGIERLGKLRILEDYAIELEVKRSHYEGALLRLDRIIAQSQRKESLLLKRADILLQAGQTDEANADYTAARAAIDALPAPRRHSRAMKQLRSDIDQRMHSRRRPGGGQ